MDKKWWLCELLARLERLIPPDGDRHHALMLFDGKPSVQVWHESGWTLYYLEDRDFATTAAELADAIAQLHAEHLERQATPISAGE